MSYNEEMNGMMGSNEEQVIRFVEKELSPEEERALLDECASSDEMRSLLKQHVMLSKRLSSTLSAVAIPIAATEKLNERLAEMRNTTTVNTTRRGVTFSAMAGALLLLIAGVTFYASQNTAQQSLQSGIAPSSIVAELPPVPAITQQDNVSSAAVAVDLSSVKPAITHHRMPFGMLEKQVVAPPNVTQNVKNDSVTVVKNKHQRLLPLGEKDIVR